MDIESFLKEASEHSRLAFQSQNRILSFKQYLEAFTKDPVRLGRTAAQYLVDAFDHYGKYEVDGIGGKVTRFRLFDAPFDQGAERLIGHEETQQEVYELLQRFSAIGRANRLVLLHGPNGSGKSTFIELIFRALEDYSRKEEGAQFRFNWIFTERMDGPGQMGFGSGKGELPKETLAFIDETLISCKITNELREPPIFLVPPGERARLLDGLYEALPAGTPGRERLRGDYLREGGMSAKSRAIYDALLTAYRGDWLKVTRHVQVERFFISKRYRVGASVVEPQQAVDANARLMTFDHNPPLPPMLQGLRLLELGGELVDANGGLLEYSDMLKRPLEMNKYLLNTIEEGAVSLAGTVAQLNSVLMGTCNEKYLSAFKANPDFTSFKGRIELIRVGYLREWKKEREVYRDFVEEIRQGKHVAPHTADVAAVWAVMTRLRRPDPAHYPDEISNIVRKLTPLDKTLLYGENLTPEQLNSEDKRALLSMIPQLRDEHNETTSEFEQFVCAAYEGRRGASAREMLALLAAAAQVPDRMCLSALSVFLAMQDLLKDRSVYDFLRLEPDEGYHHNEGFIEEVRQVFFRWVSVEIYDSMELIEPKEFSRRVEDYFRHVRAYVAGEKILNEATGKFEDPSEEVMSGLEKLADTKESADGFRKNLITKVAAYSLDHVQEKLDYAAIFPDLIGRLRDSYYKEKQKPLEKLGRAILDFDEDLSQVAEADRPRVKKTLANMRERYGYCDHCAKETISFVLRNLSTSSLGE